MANYHIELRTPDRVWDTFDVSTADLEGLRIEVARFVGELLRDHAKEIWADKDWRIDVTDEGGLILYAMSIYPTDSAATMHARR